MRKKVTAGTALLFAAALLILAGCPQEAEEYSGDVSLRSLSVNDVAARNLPQTGTSRADWEGGDFRPSTMDIAHVVFPVEAFDGDGEIKGARIQAGVADGTEIWYIKTAGGLKPADDAEWTQENIFDLKSNNSVYLQVTAADKKAQVYYRLQIHQVSAEASIKSLRIGDKNTGVSDTDGAAALEDVVLGAVNLAFGTENINARIEVMKTNNGAEVQFLRVEAGEEADPANFSDTPVYNFDDGDTVYVKVTASEGGVTFYYGAVITSLRLSSVNIGGVTVPIAGSGAASAETADATAVLITTSEATTELAVVKRTGVSIDYAYGTSADLQYTALTPETQITYVDNSTLYLKAGAEGFKDVYYKFAVAVKQNIAALESAAINSASAALPTPAGTWGGAAAAVHSLGSTVPESIVLTAAVTPGSSAAVKYGISSTAAAEPEWASSGTFTTFNSGDYVGVEVTAEDGLVKSYYKWRLGYGSSVATLKDPAPAVYIAGVPNASNGTPRAGAWNADGGANGSIYLNNTQTAVGKSVVIYAGDPNISGVAFSTNAMTNDTTAPSAWSELTRDSTDRTKWTGAWAGSAIANSRRIHIRVTAQDTLTQNFYRIQVTYQANYSNLNALTINGETVAAARRGTPAGSWNASDLVPGAYFTDAVADPLPVTFTWQIGGTNTTSYAVTSVFPPSSEPEWTTGVASPLSLSGVTAGSYIWIRGVNSTNSGNSYRNIYVIRVGPPPFSLTVAGQSVPFADLFTVNASGNTTVSGNPTPMTKVFLTEAQMANTVVGVTKGTSSDTVKVIKYLIPESGGTTVTTTAQAALFTSAPENGGTFNLNPVYPERGLPVLQVQYNGSSYYNIVPRKTVDVPITATAPAIDGDLDAVWNTAAVLTIDRVATDTTAAGLTAGTDRGAPAVIKVLWDESAIYYYAQVYDTDITVAGAEHLADCIEFFKQENWTSASTGNNWTGQYRINARGTLTGASTAANTTCAVKEDGNGYIIEAKITWSATDTASWNDKEIGAEFQIAYSIGSTRNICMGWNNRFGANYQQTANAGRLVLKR